MFVLDWMCSVVYVQYGRGCAMLTRTRTRDTSEPDPAVVGTQIVGTGSCTTRFQLCVYSQVQHKDQSYLFNFLVAFILKNLPWIHKADRNSLPHTYS